MKNMFNFKTSPPLGKYPSFLAYQPSDETSFLEKHPSDIFPFICYNFIE